MTQNTNNDISVIRSALSQLLRQDICTSIVDNTLTHKISKSLADEYNSVHETLSKFSTSSDFKQEKTNLQMVAMQYRMLMLKTMEEFTRTNDDINKISNDQMIFIHNLTVLGGKLQSYTQLMVTASNHAQIYQRIREAAILNEIDGQDALEYLRRSKNSNNADNPTRTDIKEIVTTNSSFDKLYGLDGIIKSMRQMIQNIKYGLIETFSFLIFYGIPGTGKTVMAESIATDFSNGEFYKFDQSFFASSYLGVTESRIRNIFETIRSNPKKNYVIIIDEADNILSPNTNQNHLNSVKILLQTEITAYDSFDSNLIIIAITNYLDRIDQTFLRRSTNSFLIPAPSKEQCLNFLETLLTVPNLLKLNEYYKNGLANSFNDSYQYTNSDMGRLAKKVQDTFLYDPKKEDNILITLIPSQRLIIMNSKSTSDISYPVTENNKPIPDINNAITFTGKYTETMPKLGDYLTKNNINIRNYYKYMVPNLDVLKSNIFNASTLTKTAAKTYEKSML